MTEELKSLLTLLLLIFASAALAVGILLKMLAYCLKDDQ